ncbi:MAG: hypothetical protein EBR99_03200, partial [Actinobacteria bacterium]|nr:hypothetical protein [Actinomycetota bacterium]
MAATQTLTIASGGILRAGGSTSTISGGTGITTTSGGDYVIRTDLAGDAITIFTPLVASGTNALVKTGAGTLNLQGSNGLTGGIYVNQGTLTFNTNYSSSDTTGSLGTGAKNITLNGGTLKNASANTFNPTATGLKIVVNTAGGVIDLNGAQFQLDDANQLTGAGNLTFTNTSATANTVLLGNATGPVNHTSFTGNMFITAPSGGVTLKLVTANAAGVSGNTIVMGSNSALDLQATINNNVVIGGTGIAGAGAIISSATGGGVASGYTITLTSNTLINQANSLTLSGSIVDNGAGYVLTKNGASWLNLAGANTYSGGTIWNSASSQLAISNNQGLGTGALVVDGTGANFVGTGSGSWLFNNSVILNTDIIFGAGVHSGNVAFQGSLNLDAATRGVNVYWPTQTYTFNGPVSNGSLNVTGRGTFALAGGGSLSGPLTVAAGSTLSLGGVNLAGVTTLSVGTSVSSTLNLTADAVGTLATFGTNVGSMTLGSATSQAGIGLQLGSTFSITGTGTGYAATTND